MTKYEIICTALDYQIETGHLSSEDARKIFDIASEKYSDIVTEKRQEVKSEHKRPLSEKNYNYLKNEVEKVKALNTKNNKTAEKFASELEFKKAISSINETNKVLYRIHVQLNLDSNNPPIKKSLLSKINSMIDSNEDRIKKYEKLNIKKKMNRFNNKYWIDYTKKHREAFKETEKEVLGHNTKRGLAHDYDKLIMYHFLPVPVAQALHEMFSKHHRIRAKTKKDYEQMIVDWESNRKTKPDKQLKPYQVIDKFYPKLKNKMIPILREHGLPTNAEEDRLMNNKRK